MITQIREEKTILLFCSKKVIYFSTVIKCIHCVNVTSIYLRTVNNAKTCITRVNSKSWHFAVASILPSLLLCQQLATTLFTSIIRLRARCFQCFYFSFTSFCFVFIFFAPNWWHPARSTNREIQSSSIIIYLFEFIRGIHDFRWCHQRSNKCQKCNFINKKDTLISCYLFIHTHNSQVYFKWWTIFLFLPFKQVDWTNVNRQFYRTFHFRNNYWL